MTLKSSHKKHRVLLWFIKLVSALVVLLIMWMTAEGSRIQLLFSEVPLRDLPAAFEGTKILYLSDLCINSLNTPNKVASLIEELTVLEPDLLLIGGDYTVIDPLLRLKSGSASGAMLALADMRDLFFTKLADTHFPLGKYGVAGEEDNLLSRNTGRTIKDGMALGGVTLLKDESVRVTVNGQSIVLMGADDWRTGLQDTRILALQASSTDCVILLSHNPEAVPVLNSQASNDGGKWIDLALAGHTRGGVINLFQREIINPLGSDERYQSGWHYDNGAKVLISSGVGSGALPLRLNASPQAHLITLSRQTFGSN